MVLPPPSERTPAQRLAADIVSNAIMAADDAFLRKMESYRLPGDDPEFNQTIREAIDHLAGSDALANWDEYLTEGA